MKKHLIVSLAAIMAAGTAHADGFFINPRIAWTQTHVDESRTEKAVQNGTWSSFVGNKHESWSGLARKFAPRVAVGYDYATPKYGIFGAEVEYGQTSNHFDPTRGYVDFAGDAINDSDSRDFKYSESTLSLNARYGYDLKYIIPFLSAGVGYTTIDSENNFRSGTYWWETRDSEHNMSWNIGLGIEMPVTHNIAMTIAYRYTDLGRVKYTNRMYHENATLNKNGIERNFDSNVDITKHEIMAGVKMSF
ncbi:porin family protein [bacterium]|nr:porin family protein [bacterium]